MKNILANWPAPNNIRALSTTRLLGCSQTPYHAYNLGLNLGDDDQQVLLNRRQLSKHLHLPGEPQWLEQTHSTQCVVIEETSNRRADAAITRSPQYPLAILTADCLPITLCNIQGTEIAAIHAGWRGLLHGVIENTLSQMSSSGPDLIAWIGPAICPKCFTIGPEVYDLFYEKNPQNTAALTKINKKWFANLPKLAEMLLLSQGVRAVYQSGLCTFESENEFYSYRRTPQTGRIGTLIWFNEQKFQD